MEGQEQVYLQFEAFDFENEDFKVSIKLLIRPEGHTNFEQKEWT